MNKVIFPLMAFFAAAFFAAAAYAGIPKYEELRNQGNFHFQSGEFDKAIEKYNEALKIKEDHIKSYVNRGDVYRALGQYEKSLKDYKTALSLEQDDVLALTGAGRILAFQGKTDEALKMLDHAIKYDNDKQRPYYIRGLILYNTGQYEKAAEDFEMYSKFAGYSKFGPLRYGLSMANRDRDKFEEIKDKILVRLIGPNYPFFTVLFKHIYEMEDVSWEDVLKAADNEPHDYKKKTNLTRAYYYKGEFLLLEGKKKEAVELFQKAADTKTYWSNEYEGALFRLKQLR